MQQRPSGAVYLIRVAGGEPLELIEGSQPVYSSTGHILYKASVDSVGIWALPFSLQSLEATGPPFSVAQGVGDPSIALDGTLVSVDVEGGAVAQQLVWRDRAENRLGTMGRPQAKMSNPALSPDGTKVAVTGHEDSSDQGDIWIHEVDRAVKQRLTFDAARNDLPTWSPDGREIVFRSARQGAVDLFVVGADAGGDERPFIESESREAEGDWSPDGRFFIYQVRPEGGLAFNLRYLARQQDGVGFESVPFLERAFNDSNPRLSPNGRFVAYSSSESGAPQVFVRAFPEGRGVWQVSESGGNQPRWSADGRELYWVAGSTLMAAKVNTQSGFTVGETETLFVDPNLEGSNWQYDVARDGRFVTVEDVASEEQGEKRKPAIRVVQNWYEEFRNRELD